MLNASDHCVVYITAGSEAEASTLANSLVSEGLAACVNRIGPMQSTYVWEGKLEQDTEYLLIAKTRLALLETLTARIQALHSYSTPEIIALPIVGGSAAYLNWIRQSTQES